MAQAVGGHRKFDWHKRLILPVEEFKLLAIKLSFGFQAGEHAGVDDAGEEVVQDDPLIMKPHQLLDFRKIASWVIVDLTVVEAQ